MNYLLKKKANPLDSDEFTALNDLIDNVVGNLSYPIKANGTGKSADYGEIVQLPNGNSVAIDYFEYVVTE